MRRKPLACWDRAVSIAESSSKDVSMTTAVRGCCSRTRASSSRPSMPGMRTSGTRTSTGIRFRKARRSRTEVKVLNTSIQGEEFRYERSACTTKGSSSTIATRTARCEPSASIMGGSSGRTGPCSFSRTTGTHYHRGWRHDLVSCRRFRRAGEPLRRAHRPRGRETGLRFFLVRAALNAPGPPGPLAH